MEAIGAVASILQVAQIGTQLSIRLFQIADAIASANQETNYIAKDIALFCQVLKDLAKAMEFGQKAQIFRQNAFDTSIKIVDECKRVFTEIEDILKKATKSDNPLAGKFHKPTGHKVMWIFRKGKVEFFRRLLESLKSTILVELAVLNYAIKVTSHLSKDTVDVDELLALKSLVLADEAAKQEFHDQAESSDETLDGIEISSSGVSARSRGLKVLPVSILATNDGRAPPSTSHSHAPRTAEAVRLAPSSQFIVSNSAPPYWSQIDRLELAAQKLELARWEYSRLEENIALGKTRGSIDSDLRHDFLLDRIKNWLAKFGMREELVDAAISTLKSNGTGPVPERIPIYPVISHDSEQVACFRSTGLVDPTSTDYSKEVVILRWLPDLFVDVLYEHTQDLLESSGVPRQKIMEAPRSRASEKHASTDRENSHPLLSTDQQSPNRDEPLRSKKRKSQSIDDAHPINVSGKRLVQWDSHVPGALDEEVHPEDILEQSSESEPEPPQNLPRLVFRGPDQVDSGMEVNEDDRNNHEDTSISNDDQALSPFDELGSSSKEPFSQHHILDGDRIPFPEWGNTGYTMGTRQAPEPDSGTSFFPLTVPPDDASVSSIRAGHIDTLSSDLFVPTMDESEARRTHETKKAFVVDWLNKDLVAEAGTKSDFVPEPLVFTQEPEVSLAAMQLVRPGQGRDQPKPTQVPATANASMQLFQNMSKDNYEFSLAATWGSASVDSDYDLDAYLERRRKGIEGRKDFFTEAEDDRSLQVVQQLLSKWTTVDDPVVSDNGGQLRLLTHGS